MRTYTADLLDYEKMADFARYLLGVTIAVSNATFGAPSRAMT